MSAFTFDPDELIEPQVEAALDADAMDTMTIPHDAAVVKLHALARIADNLETIDASLRIIAQVMEGKR